MPIVKGDDAQASDVLAAIAQAVAATGFAPSVAGELQIVGLLTGTNLAVPATSAGGFLEVNVNGADLRIPVFQPSQLSAIGTQPVTRTLLLQAPTGVVAGGVITVAGLFAYSQGEPDPINVLLNGAATSVVPSIQGASYSATIAAPLTSGNYTLQVQDAVNLGVLSAVVDFVVAPNVVVVTRSLTLQVPQAVVAGGVLNFSAVWNYSSGQPGALNALLDGVAIQVQPQLVGQDLTGAIPAPLTTGTHTLQLQDAVYSSVYSLPVQFQVAASGAVITRSLTLLQPPPVTVGAVINFSCDYAYSSGQPGLMIVRLDGVAITFQPSLANGVLSGAIVAPSTSGQHSLQIQDAVYPAVLSQILQVQVNAAAAPGQTIAVTLADPTAAETIATINTTGNQASVYVSQWEQGRCVVGNIGPVALTNDANGNGIATFEVAWNNPGGYLQVVGNQVTFQPIGESPLYAPAGGVAVQVIAALSLSYPAGTVLTAAGTLPLKITATNGAAAAGALVWLNIFNGNTFRSLFSANQFLLGADGTVTVSVPYQAEGDTVHVVGSLVTKQPVAIGTPVTFNAGTAAIIWAPNSVPGAFWAFNLDQVGATDVASGPIGKVFNQITGGGSQFLTANGVISLDSNQGRDGGHKALTMTAGSSWLAAGGLTGGGGGLMTEILQVAAGANRGNVTVLVAVQALITAGVWTGPIWAELDPLRNALVEAAFNGTSFAATALQTDGTTSSTQAAGITADWHVIGLVQAGNTLTAYLDGIATGSTILSSGQAFNPTDFAIGANLASGAGSWSGAPPMRISGMIASVNALAAADVFAASGQLAAIAGYQLSSAPPAPTPPVSGTTRALTLQSPVGVVAGGVIQFTGAYQYSAGAPGPMNVILSNGTTSTTYAFTPVFNGTVLTGMIIGPLAAENYSLQIQDAVYTAVLSAAVTFVVAAAPASSQTLAVLLEDPTQPETGATLTSTGNLATVYAAQFEGGAAVTGFQPVALTEDGNGNGSGIMALVWNNPGGYLVVVGNLTTFLPMAVSKLYAPPGNAAVQLITGLTLSYPSGTTVTGGGTLPLKIQATNGAAAADALIFFAVFHGSTKYAPYASNVNILGADGSLTLNIPYQAEGDVVQVVGSLITHLPIAVGTPVTFNAGEGTPVVWAPNSMPGILWAFNLDVPGAADAASGTITKIYNQVTGAGAEYLTVVGPGSNSLDSNLGRDNGHKALTLQTDGVVVQAGGASGAAGGGLVGLLANGAGGVRGTATALIAVQASINTGNWVGPVWVEYDPTQPSVIMSAFIGGGLIVEAADSVGGSNATAPYPLTADWHVIGFVMNGNTLQAVLDGYVVATTTLTSAQAFVPSDFAIGAIAPAGGTSLLGVPPQRLSSGIVTTTAMNASALFSACEMLAATAGFALSGTAPAPPMQTATALTLLTPPAVPTGTTVTLRGTFQGTPTSLDYELGGAGSGTWVTAITGLTINQGAGTYAIVLPTLAAGSYTGQVRDTNAQGVLSPVSGTFLVMAFNPANFSNSPGTTPVWYFDPNDPSLVTLNGDGTVASINNKLSSETLTAMRATSAPPVAIPSTSGKDGKRQVLQMSPTTTASQSGGPANYDVNTNWFSAGGYTPSGAVGTPTAPNMIAALNETNGNNSNFVCCFAAQINTASDYGTGPIWGQLNAPGPVQYFQACRWNPPTANKLRAQMVDTGAGYSATSTAAIASGWYVFTAIKQGSVITLRQNGSVIATGTVADSGSFTAVEFMLGGGFPPTTGNKPNQTNGVPYSSFGSFELVLGVVSASDLASLETLIGNSIGEPL